MNAASMQPKQIPLSLNIQAEKSSEKNTAKTAGPLELNENSRRGGKREKKCACAHYRTAGLSTRATMK